MSSNVDHLQGAIRRGPQAMAHAGVSLKGGIYPHQQNRHSDGSVTNFPASSQVVLHQNEIDVVYVASSATENAFASGGFIDVRVAAGSTGLITHATLEFRVRAGSGGVTQMPCPFLLCLDRVELLCEAGNTVVSSHQATQLMHPFRHLPQVALDLLQKPMGFYSDVTASAQYPLDVIAMPADSEETFYVPLISDPLATNHVFAGAFRSDMYFRVWVKPGAFIVSNGPAPTLKSLNLILTQTSLSPRDRALMAYKYQTESLDFRYQRPGYQIVRMSMGPSQRYAMALTAVLGLITELAISIVVPSNAVGGVITRKIASYELLDGAGSSVIGGSAIKSDYALHVKGSRTSFTLSLR